MPAHVEWYFADPLSCRRRGPLLVSMTTSRARDGVPQVGGCPCPARPRHARILLVVKPRRGLGASAARAGPLLLPPTGIFSMFGAARDFAETISTPWCPVWAAAGRELSTMVCAAPRMPGCDAHWYEDLKTRRSAGWLCSFVGLRFGQVRVASRCTGVAQLWSCWLRGGRSFRQDRAR